MDIIVTNQLDESSIELFQFRSFDTDLVFIQYELKTKPKGKRKYISVSIWDNYSHRKSNITEPILSENIKSEALRLFIEKIKIKTWKEFKQETKKY